MNSILYKVRKLNQVLSNMNEQDYAYSELAKMFCELLEANVYVVGERGKVLGVAYQNISDTSTILNPETGEENIPSEHIENLLRVKESKLNVVGEEAKDLFGEDYEMNEKYHTIVPIFNGDKRFGTMIFARYELLFTDEDLALAEYGSTVIGLEMRRKREEELLHEKRLLEQVIGAIDTLSYSEIEAIIRIFENIKEDEVVLVTSKIADTYGITRSVVVNALRKLESAGVITSRSLGMKGTRIKITNPKLRAEISKINLH